MQIRQQVLIEMHSASELSQFSYLLPEFKLSTTSSNIKLALHLMRIYQNDMNDFIDQSSKLV